jgi:predicted CopG family antitoxin
LTGTSQVKQGTEYYYNVVKLKEKTDVSDVLERVICGAGSVT